MNIREALDVAEKIAHEGDWTPTDFDLDTITDISEAVDILRAAERQRQAADIVEAMCKQHVASLLGDGGAVRIGDSIMRYQVKRTERCIDTNGVIGYLTQQVKADTVDLGDVVNPQYVKRSWMDQAVRETFYEWVDGDEALQTVPVDRAPKFLQKLADGETWVKP